MLTANNKNLSGNGRGLGTARAFSNSFEPFGDVGRTQAGHFDLYYLAAVAHVTRRVVQTLGTRQATFEAHPFLLEYDERLAGREPDDLPDEAADDWWADNLEVWEADYNTPLPLRDLREKCGLTHSALILLLAIGLVEEDARFGTVFESLHEITDNRRLTVGLVNAWWHDESTGESARQILHRLNELGLIQFGNMANPRSEWTVQVATLLWDVLRGERQTAFDGWAKYDAPEDLLPLEKLIVNAGLRQKLETLPRLFERGEIQAAIVRGAYHNGRKTVLGALARSLGLGLLEVKNFEFKDDERWRMIGTLAVLLNAMPVFRLDVAPSETVELPPMSEAVKVFGITLGKQGGVGGVSVEKAVTLNVNLPDETERGEHWRESLGETEATDFEIISERFRLSSGNIRRTAQLAKSYSVLANRKAVTLEDVRQAAQALNRQVLDTLALYLEPLAADWSFLAVREDTMRDLQQLEERCRVRERLRGGVGVGLQEQLQAGVRALFNGASGTGKTYAARLLAAALQKDLYRLDLSTVVNKYIGETEKNLARVLAHVEELDVILLLDEGDALLTQRTNVGSANDRYANLETNYLLQRLESFEGILIVTTNAHERIDAAFQRRMDAVVEFAPPDAAERWQIWQLHLPAENNISPQLLNETVQHCELTGGQIRNISLHAASLALGQKTPISGEHLEAAVRREYRKNGTICPLPQNLESNIMELDRW